MQPKVSVLVVDDNATDRRIVHAMLQKLGFTDLQDAENGTLAVSKIETALEIGKPFRFVLLDWNMPSANGLKVLQRIRANSRLKQLKIVIMTATAEIEIVQDAITNGADEFLVKPFVLLTLKDKLGKLGISTL